MKADTSIGWQPPDRRDAGAGGTLSIDDVHRPSVGDLRRERSVAPWSRVAILIGALFVVGFLSYRFTGSLIPGEPGDALVFQNALLLIVFGSALLEHKFTKPGDSAVNALMGIVTLITVYGESPPYLWWGVTAYCLLTFVLAATCTAVSTGPYLEGWRAVVARVTYQPAVLLGKARLLFSIVFLFGVFSFYEIASDRTAVLLVFWGVFVALWPLRFPELMSGFASRTAGRAPIGRVLRTDAPNLIRVALPPGSDWSESQAEGVPAI